MANQPRSHPSKRVACPCRENADEPRQTLQTVIQTVLVLADQWVGRAIRLCPGGLVVKSALRKLGDVGAQDRTLMQPTFVNGPAGH